MKRIFLFVAPLVAVYFFVTPIFSYDCIGVLNGNQSTRQSCRWPFDTRYEWRDADLVQWGDGAPGRQWSRSAFGQCNSTINCSPTVGIIVHTAGEVRQRWTNGITTLDGTECINDEIIYTRRPDACTPCGNQTGVPCGNGGNGCGAPPYNCSPILLDINGDGYALTDYYHGVSFDLSGRGYVTQTSWTAVNSDDAFLVLDRNGNGVIDNGLEVFGDSTEQPESPDPNGFIALAVFDKLGRGGNNDGEITESDMVFNQLRLWRDCNHNGVSEPSELNSLQDLGVIAIDLDYQTSRRVDQYGNRFRFRSKVKDTPQANVGRWSWDVFFMGSPPNNP